MEKRKDIRMKISGDALEMIEFALDVWYSKATEDGAGLNDEYNHGRYDGAISVLSALGLTIRSTVGTNDNGHHLEYHGN